MDGLRGTGAFDVSELLHHYVPSSIDCCGCQSVREQNDLRDEAKVSGHRCLL